MNKHFLFYLFFAACIVIVSCSKTESNITNSNTQQDTVFIPVELYDIRFGGSFCSYGYFMVRQDTAITYHCLTIPAYANIGMTPVSVNIQFHDTIIPQSISCWPHEIVIDSIKF